MTVFLSHLKAKYPEFILKKGKNIPFGYTKYDDDPQLLRADYTMLGLKEQAVQYHKKHGVSMRECATWLTQHSGRYVSQVTIFNWVHGKKSCKFQKRAATPAPASGREGNKAAADTGTEATKAP